MGDNPSKSLEKFDVVLTTYGMLLRQKWLLDVPWRLVILDEAQAIKNPATRQRRTVKQLKADARIALTGTPVENRLSDLWSLFDFLCPGLLGSAAKFQQFVKDLEAREHDRYAPLRNLVGPYVLRRLKTDKRIITDLPDKTEMKAFCGLSKKQAALYAKAVEELALALENLDGIRRRGLVLAYLMRFKQICNHPSQYLGDGGYEPADSGKFDRLRELCEEIASRQEKVLVFTQFREMTEPLAAFLGGVFRRAGLVLHGGTAVKRRRALIETFQEEEGPPFLVLSLKAGGTGLNLTGASHVVHEDEVLADVFGIELAEEVTPAKTEAASEKRTSRAVARPVTGKAVAALRAKFGMSQSQFASLLGVSAPSVGNWEKEPGALCLQTRTLAAWNTVRRLTKRQAWRKLEGS
jgi:non-specific serine/threonine protein kinase